MSEIATYPSGEGRLREFPKDRPLSDEERAEWMRSWLLAIESGLRWGELIALRPVDIDFPARTINVRRTIGEVSRKHSPTGERFFIKEYPKSNEPRLVQIPFS